MSRLPVLYKPPSSPPPPKGPFKNLPGGGGGGPIAILLIPILFFGFRIVTKETIKEAFYLSSKTEMSSSMDDLEVNRRNTNSTTYDPESISKTLERLEEERRQLESQRIAEDRYEHWQRHTYKEVQKDLCFISKYDMCYGKSQSAQIEATCSGKTNMIFKGRKRMQDKEVEEANLNEHIILINDKGVYQGDDYFRNVEELKSKIKYDASYYYEHKGIVKSDTLRLSSESFVGCLLSMNRMNKRISGEFWVLSDITICKKGPIYYPRFKIKKEKHEIIVIATEPINSLEIKELER